MALALHKPTKTLRSGVGPADLVPADDWILNPVIPSGCELPYIVLEGDSIRAMTDEERGVVNPETTAERHLREQREGVTLSNGWVMAYTREARDVMGDLKNLIDLAGQGLPGVSFWEVNGTKHDVTINDALAVLTDYAVKSATEVMRQYGEVGNG